MHPRIVVVGTSGSGKSTFSRQFADQYPHEHIQLDELHFGPNWRSHPEFEQRVAIATQSATWIADGNYSKVRHLTWTRATALLWLDFPFHIVFRRALLRTCKRVLTSQKLYGDNRENWRFAFFHPDGIPWWVIRTYHRNRREIPARLKSYSHLTLYRCGHPSELKRFFSTAINSSSADLKATD